MAVDCKHRSQIAYVLMAATDDCVKEWIYDNTLSPKSLNLEAKLLPSVLKATVRAVEKELEECNTEASVVY